MPTVSLKGMKEIHDIACEGWKKKLKSWTDPFADTTLSDSQVREMFEAATADQKKILNKWLKEPGEEFKDKIQEKLDKLSLPYSSKSLTKEQKSVNALVQMFVIAEVMNEGEILTWENTSEYKYLPYKWLSGGRWVLNDRCWSSSNAGYPSGVCLKSSALAIKAYEMFPEIYDDYYMFKG